MTASHKPESPLPWSNAPCERHYCVVRSESIDWNVAHALKGDAAYLVHAANAYPQLIEFVKADLNNGVLDRWREAEHLLKELEEL